MKHLIVIDPEFDPAIHPEFSEPPFKPTTVAAARDNNPENGLVWWRPYGVISLTNPEGDVAMVRQG
jgi:hypothetical protein